MDEFLLCKAGDFRSPVCRWRRPGAQKSSMGSNPMIHAQ
jgi:hypothetical protein